jgi:hypothetical protein
MTGGQRALQRRGEAGRALDDVMRLHRVPERCLRAHDHTPLLRSRHGRSRAVPFVSFHGSLSPRPGSVSNCPNVYE